MRIAIVLLAMLGLAQDRFDYKVREDFFAGLAGNRQAMERAMKTCEGVLAAHPKDPEALVWHGSGLYYQAAAYFQKGDIEKGKEMSIRGMKEMDQAVELEPKSIAVRIPRGAFLIGASRYTPPERSRPLLERALADYEFTYSVQKATLDQLGEHARGELLFGLADGYSRLGDKDKARTYFEMLARDMKGTEYAKRAALWMEKGSLPLEKTGCIGCHVKE